MNIKELRADLMKSLHILEDIESTYVLNKEKKYTKMTRDLIDKGLEFLVMIADQKELLPIVLLAAIKFQDCVLSMQKMANSYLNIKNIKSLEAKHG